MEVKYIKSSRSLSLTHRRMGSSYNVIQQTYSLSAFNFCLLPSLSPKNRLCRRCHFLAPAEKKREKEKNLASTLFVRLLPLLAGPSFLCLCDAPRDLFYLLVASWVGWMDGQAGRIRTRSGARGKIYPLGPLTLLFRWATVHA